MSIVGKYDLVEPYDGGNLDTLFESMGINIEMRKSVDFIFPTRLVITEINGEYSIKTISILNNREIKFKLGEEFDEELPVEDIHCKSKIVQVDNKLVHEQKVGDKSIKLIREFTDQGMKLTMEGPAGISCTRIYNRKRKRK